MSETDIIQSGVELLAGRTVIELSSRWVRVQFDHEFVAGSKSALLLRRGGGRLAYYFAEQDVRMKHLVPAQAGSDGRRYFDVRVRDQVAKSAAWKYSDPPQELAMLNGYFSFHWRRMDHWFEEDEEIFGHPRDPYHRVDSMRSSRGVRIELAGIVLAETKQPTILFETGLPPRYYIPVEDVRMELLEKSKAKTICPYKGEASYWSVNVGGDDHRNLVWAYNAPLPESAKIAGMLCFFNEKVDLFVDGELQERPQTLWSKS